MVEISYGTVMDVTLSWDKLKQTPNYKDVTGQLILSKIFEVEPQVKKLFNVSPEEHPKESPRLSMHARTLVDMIDCAVSYLGPNLDPLEEELIEMGKRHVNYGVRPEFLPIMADALFHALAMILGSSLNDQDKRSWDVVVELMVTNMLIGMKLAENANSQ